MSCTYLRIILFKRYLSSWLQSGTPTAHGKIYLPLLPSGPDGIGKLPLRRTQPSTPLI